MKFYKGDKVFLTETSEVGIVTRVEDERLLYVMVDKVEIPVFSSDVTREIPEEMLTEHSNQQFYTNLEKETAHFDELGLFVCFEPLSDLEEVKEFNIYLVNSFSVALDFTFHFFLGDDEIFTLKTEIYPQESFLLFTITYDELNENPSFDLAIQRKDSNKEPFTFSQKVKPNNLFNKQIELDFFEGPVYAYQLLELWPMQKEVYVEDLKSINLKAIEEKVMNRLKAHELPKKNFVSGPVAGEIDLHIEKLFSGYGSLTNGEIVQIQLKSFREGLERAIIGGLERFYVIHGLGKGVLRDEIFRILPEYPQVKSFRNEYHPRYGFGATEIFLK